MKKNTKDLDSQLLRPIGIAYLVGRVDHVLSRRIRDALAPYGLTTNQYTALSALAAHEHLSNAQLAERSLVSPQAANEMVKTMEARGWIAREPDASHGRIVRIRVTAAGHALLVDCDAAVAAIEQAMLAALPDAARDTLHDQLRTMLGALRKLVDDPAHY